MSNKELGDLREVEKHVRDLLAGIEEAEGELMTFGRDAAGIVLRIGEEKKNDTLKALSKRLIAVPPQVDTNMMELRHASVKELVSAAQDHAPNATEVRDFAIASPQVALFDPLRIADALVKSGKPRKDPERINKGDLVWFGTSSPSIQVTLTTAPLPEHQPAAAGRLKVESGIVFVGPPEASDGPRLGEVRLDPFRTNLHLHHARGKMVRLKAGMWKASAYQAPGGAVRVHLSLDADPSNAAGSAETPVDVGALVVVPFAALDPGNRTE